MNKFLVLLFALLMLVTSNDSFAARKKAAGKKGQVTSAKSHKSKKKGHKLFKKNKKMSKKATVKIKS